MSPIRVSYIVYGSEILKKVGMMNCKPVSTSMTMSEKLSAHDGVTLEPQDATRYRSVAGELQYLTSTRPNLSFPVNKVCQFYTSLQLSIGQQ
jgi:hypothetical protein